jgi:Fe-S-cluster containining protein
MSGPAKFLGVTEFRETLQIIDEHTAPRWLAQARESGGEVACDNCKRAACCSLQVTAYLPEVQILAERILRSRDYDMLMRLEAWTVRYLTIPPDLRRDETEVFRRGLACPFYIGGRCTVYEDRPVSCRLHYVLGKDERGCQPGWPEKITKINQTWVHAQLSPLYGLPRVMVPSLFAMLRPDHPTGRAAFAAMEELTPKLVVEFLEEPP